SRGAQCLVGPDSTAPIRLVNRKHRLTEADSNSDRVPGMCDPRQLQIAMYWSPRHKSPDGLIPVPILPESDHQVRSKGSDTSALDSYPPPASTAWSPLDRRGTSRAND